LAIIGLGRRPSAAVAANVTAAPTSSTAENFEPAIVAADHPGTAPSARAQDRPESWQNNAFWKVQKPSPLAPLLPTRTRAWQKTTDMVREQLDVVLPSVVSEPASVQSREKLAEAVKTATALAFDNRSYTALRSSIAKLSAGWTAVLVGASLAVVACVRWQLAWPVVFVMLAAQAVFLVLAYAFETYVFPGVLHWGFGSSRWSHTPRLYARTVTYLIVGVGAMVAVLTLADRHHRLTGLEHVGLAAPLGCLAVAAGLWTAVGVAALGELVRPPQDPYPELVTSLLEADSRL
jgi:hypothetical protein